jgi:hypothetical protein
VLCNACSAVVAVENQSCSPAALLLVLPPPPSPPPHLLPVVVLCRQLPQCSSLRGARARLCKLKHLEKQQQQQQRTGRSMGLHATFCLSSQNVSWWQTWELQVFATAAVPGRLVRAPHLPPCGHCSQVSQVGQGLPAADGDGGHAAATRSSLLVHCGRPLCCLLSCEPQQLQCCLHQVGRVGWLDLQVAAWEGESRRTQGMWQCSKGSRHVSKLAGEVIWQCNWQFIWQYRRWLRVRG